MADDLDRALPAIAQALGALHLRGILLQTAVEVRDEHLAVLRARLAEHETAPGDQTPSREARSSGEAPAPHEVPTPTEDRKAGAR